MPELPEVETIVRFLRNPIDLPLLAEQPTREQPGVIGRLISGVELNWLRTLATPDLEEFNRRVIGQTIQNVERRGKFIVMSVGRESLLFHLRMSGDLRVEAQSAPQQTHDRFMLNFMDGTRLVFNDTRKFGRVWLVEDRLEVLGKLGPEPFDQDLTGTQLYQRWRRSSRAIKTLLLDQSILAGVGNIYSDEALFLAKVHPLTPGNAVTPRQSDELLAAIKTVLAEGIKRNGASIDWVYRGGDFQNYFNVYQRTGEVCLVCGTPIERLVIGQRSSHFCPTCQPLKS